MSATTIPAAWLFSHYDVPIDRYSALLRAYESAGRAQSPLAVGTPEYLSHTMALVGDTASLIGAVTGGGVEYERTTVGTSTLTVRDETALVTVRAACEIVESLDEARYRAMVAVDASRQAAQS